MCSKTPWNISIEPISSCIGGMGQSLNSVTLKTMVISDDEVYRNVTVYQLQNNIEDHDKKQAIEKYKLEQQ